MLCDENILWSQAVFEVFYSPGKFSLCGEVWLVAGRFGLLQKFSAPEFSKPGKEVFCKKVTKASYQACFELWKREF